MHDMGIQHRDIKVENILLDAMFEAPSKKNIKSVRVLKESVTEGKELEIERLTSKEIEERDGKKTISAVPDKEKVAV